MACANIPSMTRLLPAAPNVHVLVVGDIMLDRYIHGTTDRVSREAPVPVVQVDGSEDRLGGAANVAKNVVALGGRCTLVGAVGDDPTGRTVTMMLEAAGIDTDLVVVDGWRTTLKERLVSMQQQLVRMDFEQSLPSEYAADVVARAARHMAAADALVIEDYDKGAIADPQRIMAAAAPHALPVIADPKFKPFSAYGGVTILKPNRPEFEAALGYWPKDRDLPESGCALAKASGVDAITLTRGGDGLTVFEATGACLHVPAASVDVYDETGAGDTVAATLGVCTALGWPRAEAARIANVAGGLVCTKFGTAVASAQELNLAARTISAQAQAPRRRQLTDAVARSRRHGERIVFTNGCFDILHAGHVGYLNEARELGDRLIVAVNDDDSVRRLKGDGRPVNPLEDRVRVLEGLASVDWVVPFSEDTPEALLAEIRPDVLVKGGDYAIGDVIGADFVRGYGGDVRVLGLIDDCSTTDIVDRIRMVDG